MCHSVLYICSETPGEHLIHDDSSNEVCSVCTIGTCANSISVQDSSEDLSDVETEETLVHAVSSDDSDSEGDETESLASSVAELSSGVYC